VALKNSVPSVSWFTATAGRPSRTISVSRSHREVITGKINPKNPARVPDFSLIRNAWLSGVRKYLDWRSFFSNCKPTSASMIARKPRADAPVSFSTCSTVFAPPSNVSKTLLFTAALMISGGA